MGYKITKETLDRIQMLAAEYSALEVAGTASPEWKSKKAAMERLQKKNKEAGISLLDSCFCGPESMNKLLVDAFILLHNRRKTVLLTDIPFYCFRFRS